MFTLLRNYIREQKNSWLQVFGLGFLVIIMVTTFLSLNFATTYLTKQYSNDIAENQFHQNIYFNIPSIAKNNTFFKTDAYNWDKDNAWLENMNYYNKSSDGKINIDDSKLKDATFQIRSLIHDKAKHLYTYQFIYNHFDTDSNNIAVGTNFANKVGHNFIDFKISAPFNYPSQAVHNSYIDSLANMIDQYVYKGSSVPLQRQNRINFFITSQMALDRYNQLKSHGKISYATRNYVYQDIVNQAKLYQTLIIGMLYGDNVSWRRVSNLTDIIMTGKTLAFIQTTLQDVVNKPILVKNGGSSLDRQPLQNDEILIYQDFAKQNHLKIGDTYVFAGHKFIIRGFATSSITANKHCYFPNIDDKNNSIAFVNEHTFNEISSDPYLQIEVSDFIVYNPDMASKKIAPGINNYWFYNYFHQTFEKKLKDNSLFGYNLYNLKASLANSIDAAGFMEPLNFNHYYNSIFEAVSIGQLNSLKAIFDQISSVFLTLIFIVTTVIIFIVIFKMIDRNKQLIGILKANGCQSWKLNLALILAIIVPLIAFAILGAVIAIFVSKFIISGFSAQFALITINFSFYFLPTILVIVIPILALLLISFLVVSYLLKTPPLMLINNKWSKNKYNISVGIIFTFLTSFVIKKFNYRNKLVITNTFRSWGKISLIVIVSFFASILMLFALASNGLINNMLGLQFSSINYNYDSQYDFSGSVTNNFINANGQLLYKKEDVQTIKAHPSLYLPIRQAIVDYINSKGRDHPIVDCRYGYIMGSELLKIRKEVIQPAIDNHTLPAPFLDFWNKNIFFINYLTNNNGQSNTDLMINFGLLAYNSTLENPYTQLDFNQASSFNIDNFDSSQIYYDNQTNTLVGNWDNDLAASRIVYGVNQNTSKYLDPGFKNTNFLQFSNLNLNDMQSSSWWQDQKFIDVRNQIIQKLKIQNPDTASVQIIPMVSSTVPSVHAKLNGGDGNDLNKIVIYPYQGLDKQTKYIFGVVYDGAKNLLANTILMPGKWLNHSILGNGNNNLVNNFANAKLTNFNSNELHNYLPIISSYNDYNFDISQLFNNNYLASKGITPGLKMLYDVNAIKELVKAQQYTFQVLLSFFGVFCLLLTLMIIIIISNINIRDNLILINILRSLGYSFFEISYIFLIVTIPLLIICSIFAIYVAPILVAILSSSLTTFTGIFFPVIFKWWYFALSFLTVILIYFVSYLITWKLNVSHKHLMKLTK